MIAFDAHRSYVLGLAFTPDGQTLVSSGMDAAVKLWSVADWTLQRVLPVGTKAVNGLAFSPDGRWFAAGAADNKIRVWALEDPSDTGKNRRGGHE